MWGKKQGRLTTTAEKEDQGDHWDANCLDSQSKLLVSLVPGKRTGQAFIEGLFPGSVVSMALHPLEPLLTPVSEALLGTSSVFPCPGCQTLLQLTAFSVDEREWL